MFASFSTPRIRDGSGNGVEISAAGGIVGTAGVEGVDDDGERVDSDGLVFTCGKLLLPLPSPLEVLEVLRTSVDKGDAV